MIRAKHPRKVWLRSQTPAYRLAEMRMFKRLGRATGYQCRRIHAVLSRLEVDAVTPLQPGEKLH